jgi:hypothetical protein
VARTSCVPSTTTYAASIGFPSPGPGSWPSP